MKGRNHEGGYYEIRFNRTEAYRSLEFKAALETALELLAKILEAGQELDPTILKQLRTALNNLLQFAGFNNITELAKFFTDLYSGNLDGIIENYNTFKSLISRVIKRLGVTDPMDPKFLRFLEGASKYDQN